MKGKRDGKRNKLQTAGRPDGQTVAGDLTEPANAVAAPGIVVMQEWWGLNDQIKGAADNPATAGYRALVPGLYRGKAPFRPTKPSI